jgi:hypothetical protein
MMQLTNAQTKKVFGAPKYTHDYETESAMSFDATGNPRYVELMTRFEKSFDWDELEEMGWLWVYALNGEPVATYDYSDTKGTVFAMLDT